MIEDLGEKLRFLRQKRRLSQAQLAESISATPALISAYELGERVPSLPNLIKLASFFHVSTDYLLGLPIQNIPDFSGLTEEEAEAFTFLIQALKER